MARSHVLVGADQSATELRIRDISFSDIKDALRAGVRDFAAMPTHAIFLCVIYPVVGLIAARLAFGYSFLPLLYPLMTGFALLGPVAALGLFELSRQREAGKTPSAAHALDVLRSSSLGGIVALGAVLATLFLIWIAVANAIYIANFGYAPPESIATFVRDVLTTGPGWTLIILGNGIGFLFAVVVLTVSVVSFPLLLDRDVGAAVALLTSIRVVMKNPLTMAVWGLIVAALLLLGSLPLFVGLTVVMPILGHATWHLYRKAVESDGSPPPTYRTPVPGRRFAADFPAVLFPWAR